MNEFERKIRDLPWHQPPDALKSRIFGQRRPPARIGLFFDRRIAMRWAAVLALATGLLGYVIGQWGQARAVESVEIQGADVDLQMVETGTGQNFFDLSDAPGDILPGDLAVAVAVGKEQF